MTMNKVYKVRKGDTMRIAPLSPQMVLRLLKDGASVTECRDTTEEM